MSIFAIIELILKALSLLDGFNSYMDTKRAAENAKRAQDRSAAIDDSKKAETDDEIWKSQQDVANNQPKP